MIPKSEVKDPDLLPEGRARIAWAWAEMPLLRRLELRFAEDQPLVGARISACLHVTTETANLMRVLQAGGASVSLCASNPLSTQDDVAAAVARDLEVPVHAVRGASSELYYRHIGAALDHEPHLTMDDGADLVSMLHADRRELLGAVVGGTEETTTGVARLRAMAADGALTYPVIAVNDTPTKHLFDNRYGTGQSTIDGILRATNILLAGRTFVVCGYGWCGRGIANRARGMGAHVVVTEVQPLPALEATMDGFEVMPLLDAATRAHFIVTATGDKHVVDARHFAVMKDGCVLANAGHFDVEIDLDALSALASDCTVVRPSVSEYRLPDGRRVRVLASGRLVNLSAAEGHPAAVMDMSFANQALVLAYLWARGDGPGASLAPGVHPVPRAIDERVAHDKLAALGVRIDTLTEAQQRYLASWREGT